MFRTLSRICTLFTAATISGAVNAQGLSLETKVWCARAVPALRETLRVSPQEQAARAIGASDLRYFEWYGLTSAIPGVKSQECARQANIMKPFEGTSDALCSEEHHDLYKRSYAYAESYNRHIALERRARGLATCNDA